MQEIGNVITVIGVIVTLVAYFGRHSGVSLYELEPRLMSQWSSARGWVRRKLRRSTSVTVNVEGAASIVVTASARGSVWSPIQPDDDIDVRAEKLAQNLDRLRDQVEENRSEQESLVLQLEQRLTERASDLETRMIEQQLEGRQVATAAMRWEVRGLMLTLVGTVLSILG
ncbi:hypothetical protein GCM10022234_35870 [Aeromicrobium panaciterrae]|uniref:hypothetical protein n=1 Tax=Aeromicrobium panaciterrae TaxID=363861 RepID=UPI0031E20E72